MVAARDLEKVVDRGYRRDRRRLPSPPQAIIGCSIFLTNPPTDHVTMVSAAMNEKNVISKLLKT